MEPIIQVFDDKQAFGAALPSLGSLLAIDASKRRFGLAGTDAERRLVTALVTLERRQLAADVLRLGRMVDERRAVGLVLGLPFNMDGSEGPMAKTARYLAGRFAADLALPVLLQDERLTTFVVEEAIAAGRLPRPRRNGPIDHYAAAVILEDALRDLAAVASPKGP